MEIKNKLVSLATLGAIALGMAGCKGKVEKKYLISRAHSPTVELKSTVIVYSPARDEIENNPDYMVVSRSGMRKLGLDPSKYIEYKE